MFAMIGWVRRVDPLGLAGFASIAGYNGYDDNICRR